MLVQLRDAVDPDTGQRFTVKRHRSEKTADDSGWRHVRIVLEPLNSDYEPIGIAAEDEDSAAVPSRSGGAEGVVMPDNPGAGKAAGSMCAY